MTWAVRFLHQLPCADSALRMNLATLGFSFGCSLFGFVLPDPSNSLYRLGCNAHSGMTYESSAFAYAAAMEGHGVAIAQLFLVEGDLAAEKLKRPFTKSLDMGDYTYYLLTPKHRPESPQMEQFRLWLLEHLGEAG
jgi:DNA-binding transcriptional LysR family regulator